MPTDDPARIATSTTAADSIGLLRRGLLSAATAALVGLAVGLGAGQAHSAPVDTAVDPAAVVTALYPVVPGDSAGQPGVPCGPANAGQIVVTSDADGGVHYHRCGFHDDVRVQACLWEWDEIVRPD